MFKKTHITTLCLVFTMFLLHLTVCGQQSQPFTQYLFNRFLLNPAACGANGYTSIGLIVKNQWAGFSYRSGGDGVNGGTSVIFGVRFENYNFGYAFDYNLSNIQKYSYGSHELMASVTFGRTGRSFHYKRRYEFQDSEQQYRRTWLGKRNR